MGKDRLKLLNQPCLCCLSPQASFSYCLHINEVGFDGRAIDKGTLLHFLFLTWGILERREPTLQMVRKRTVK